MSQKTLNVFENFDIILYIFKENVHFKTFLDFKWQFSKISEKIDTFLRVFSGIRRTNLGGANNIKLKLRCRAVHV